MRDRYKNWNYGNSLNNLPKIKSLKQIEKEEEIKKQQNEEKKLNMKAEKTTTTNYSDEENKNNAMFGKKEIKQTEEINKENIPYFSNLIFHLISEPPL